MEHRLFLGWDEREVLPWHVLNHSIVRLSSKPVSITPVKLSQLPISRPPSGSTEFSLSRFLVPWMCGYQGLALFMDCDMLVRCDITELFDMKDESAVQVVQHDYVPRETVKFYGNRQVAYSRKNWSSVMLFDCAQCEELSPEYVDTATPSELHQLLWTDSIGSLPTTYNHLVGEYAYRDDAKIVHWTNGGPWLTKYRHGDYAGDWFQERDRLLRYTDEC